MGMLWDGCSKNPCFGLLIYGRIKVDFLTMLD